MVKKIFLLSLVSFGLLFFVVSVKVPAESAEQFSLADTFRKEGNYEQAEAIYQQIVIDFPDSNDALEAQKQLTLMYITTDGQQQADAAFAELTAVFAGHKEIAAAVWKIAKEYEESKKYEKALELHQYNVENFSSDMYAMWSQVEVTYFHINSGDNTAADAAFEKLLTLFSSQPTLPKEVHKIAMKYKGFEKHEKALELHQYNVENFSSDMYAMWSQVEIVYSYIRDTNDTAAADAAVDKLLTVFSKQPTLPKEVHQIAMKYKSFEKHEKALELYRYNVEHFSSDMYAMWSQVEIVYSYIRDTNDTAAADAAVDKLLTVFSKQPTLPKELYQIADVYSKAGRYDKSIQLHNYNVDNFPDDMYAMLSQVDIVYSCIGDAKDVNDTAVDAAVDKLLTVFSGQPTLPERICEVAKKLDGAKKTEKALQLHRYNVGRFSADKYAMWSQVEIVKSHIRDANNAAADAAVDKLLTVFSKQTTFPKELYQIADLYGKAGRYDKSIQIHNYNVDNFADDMYAMLSQVDIVYSCIGDAKDANNTAADAAIDKLISVFYAQPDLPEEIYEIADKYQGLKKLEKAYRYYQYVAENFSDDDYALMSQQQMVSLNLQLGDQAGAWAGVEKLIDEFKDDENIAEAVSQVAKTYHANKKFTEAIELYQYVLENCPDDEPAIWAQVHIAEINIELGVDDGADAAFEKLCTQFSKDKRIAEAVYKVAYKFNQEGKQDKGAELHQYNVAQYPDDKYAMWSQVEIVKSHIRDANGAGAAEAAVEKLISVFSGQPTLPKEVYQIANVYKDAGQYYRAIRLYQRVAQTWPDDSFSILSQEGIAKVNISLDHYAAVDAVIGAIIADYNDHPLLPKVVFRIGEEYYYMAFEDPNKCQRVKSKENLREAANIWERIVAQWPQSQAIDVKHAWNFLANCYRKLGDYKKAVVCYQKLLADWPDYQYAWSAQYLIGSCYEKLRDSGVIPPSEAEEKIKQAYKTVIEKYPDCSLAAQACLKLGYLNQKRGHKIEAAAYFEIFLATARPSDPRIESIKSRIEELKGEDQ